MDSAAFKSTAVFDLACQLQLRASDSIYGFDVGSEVWALQKVKSGRYEWFAGTVKQIKDDVDKLVVAFSDDPDDVVEVPKKECCSQFSKGDTVEVRNDPNDMRFYPAKILQVDTRNCEYYVEMLQVKALLRAVPRERIRRPLPRSSHVKVYYPTSSSDWHDGTVTHYDEDKHEYEVKLESVGRGSDMGSTILSPRTVAGRSVLSLPPCHLFPCLPPAIVKSIRREASKSGDVIERNALFDVLDDNGVLLSAAEMNDIEASLGAEGGRLLVSKLLDGLMTSDGDFGIPVKSPATSDAASRRDTPTASAIKKTQSMQIMSGNSHGKSVSLAGPAIGRGSDDVITFDAKALAVCVLPKAAKDKLAAAVAKDRSMFTTLDGDDAGSLPRSEVTAALHRRVDDVPHDIITNTVDCFDYQQDGNIKYPALTECLLSPTESEELCSVLTAVFHALCGKPDPQAALVELRDAFVNSDKEASTCIARRQFKTIVEAGLGWSPTTADLSVLIAAFPSHDGSDSITYDAFLRRLSDAKSLPRVQLTLRQFAVVYSRLGGSLAQAFQFREAQLKAKGVENLTSAPTDSITGHLPFPQFIDVFAAVGAPLSPSQLRTLALCATVPKGSSGAGSDSVLIDTRAVIDAALGKRDVAFGMGAPIDRSPSISKGKLHTRAKSEFMPRFKSDTASSRHAPQPSYVTTDGDLQAPTDSTIPYLHMDDVHTNAHVVDDCEAAMRRHDEEFEKWDLDDYFRPPVRQISYVKTQSAAKPAVIRRTFVDTDSDSDWEDDEMTSVRLSRADTPRRASTRTAQQQHSDTFRAWRGMIGVVFFASSADGRFVGRAQVPNLLAALGLETFGPHQADIIRRELVDDSDRVNVTSFVRIVRQCARLERLLGLSLLVESRLVSALTALPEVQNLPIPLNGTLSRHSLYCFLRGDAFITDLIDEECIAIALHAPGPNLLRTYGIVDVDSTSMEPSLLPEEPEVSIRAFMEWLRCIGSGVWCDGCDSAHVRHGCRKLCYGFPAFPVPASKPVIQWCDRASFSGADAAASTKATAPASKETLRRSGPLLYLHEVLTMPNTYRLSELACIASHPSQALSSLLLPRVEADPGDFLLTSSGSTDGYPTLPAIEPGTYDASGVAASVVYGGSTMSKYGIDGNMLATRGVGCDGVGVALRTCDYLPHVGVETVGCGGGSRFVGVDANAIRPLSPGLPDDTVTGKRVRETRQAIVSLLTSEGIPSVADAERSRVVARAVRISLVDAVPTAKPDGSRRLRVLANQHRVDVTWDYREEDRWHFNGAPSKHASKFIVRTDHPRVPCGLNCNSQGCVNHLFVLFELTTTFVRDPKSIDVPVPPTAEFTTAWGMIRFVDLCGTTGSQKFTIDLKGGSPIAPEEIRAASTLQRRSGWRTISKAIQGASAPKLMIAASPLSVLNKSTMMQLGLLPANILLPVADAPVIGMVRSCLAADTSLIAEGIPKAPLGSTEVLFQSLPAEAVFAMLCNEPHTLAVLTSCWNRTLKVSKRPASPAETRRLFRDMLLRLWPVLVCRPVPVPGAITHPLSFLDNTRLDRVQDSISRDARLLLAARTVDENMCFLPVDTAATTLPLL